VHVIYLPDAEKKNEKTKKKQGKWHNR